MNTLTDSIFGYIGGELRICLRVENADAIFLFDFFTKLHKYMKKCYQLEKVAPNATYIKFYKDCLDNFTLRLDLFPNPHGRTAYLYCYIANDLPTTCNRRKLQEILDDLDLDAVL